MENKTLLGEGEVNKTLHGEGDVNKTLHGEVEDTVLTFESSFSDVKPRP